MKSAPVSAFARRLRSEWRLLELPAKDKTIVLAVSGGADSSALLAAFAELQNAAKLDFKIIVAHFNHNLRGEESRKDAKFVKKLAARCGFLFEDAVWETEELINDNLEQAARRARYRFLRETAVKYCAFAVLTAHTLNDQAETFLLRLLRGSAAEGLGGMKPIRFLEPEISNCHSEVLLIRPLLTWARRETTEEYCRDKTIDFRFDAMNNNTAFNRVGVRRKLLPLLKTFNPQIIETLAQTADLLREDAEELNQIAENILKTAFQEDKSLKVSLIVFYSPAQRRRTIRLWLKNLRGSLRQISFKHLQGIDNLLVKSAGGKYVELPGGAIVLKQKNRLIYRQTEVEK